jgi:hypothetical protein
MKPEKNEKVTRLLLSLLCFTAYIFLFIAVIANAFNARAHDLLLG